MYRNKDNPSRYGILYVEENGRIAETAWYDRPSERDTAVFDIKRTGTLEVGLYGSPIGKTVNIHAFTEVDADMWYWTKYQPAEEETVT